MDFPDDDGFYSGAVTTLPTDMDLSSLLRFASFQKCFELDHVYDPDRKFQPKPSAQRC